MPCRVIKVGDATAIVCGGRGKPKRCKCGAPAQFLCDHQLGNGKTCDAPLCAVCTSKPARNVDLCVDHARPKPQSDLFP